MQAYSNLGLPNLIRQSSSAFLFVFNGSTAVPVRLAPIRWTWFRSISYDVEEQLPAHHFVTVERWHIHEPVPGAKPRAKKKEVHHIDGAETLARCIVSREDRVRLWEADTEALFA